ncbi:hypothetical protein VZT92_003417 [Zoarces viviparus]|uniref:Secreted protein n=1 Tax=Zoarces viviparus TaxID=48416 RepID=A0AAW1G2I9_ZOAVI
MYHGAPLFSSILLPTLMAAKRAEEHRGPDTESGDQCPPADRTGASGPEDFIQPQTRGSSDGGRLRRIPCRSAPITAQRQ